MVQPQYNPQESLERVKLMMGYDMSKTLNENKNIIFEQSGFDYFTEMVRTYMKYPKSIPNVNFGTPKIDAKKNAKVINDAVSQKTFGAFGGRDSEGLDYVIGKSFNNIADSMSLIKTYPDVGEESLYEAIDGEWFSGDIMKTIVDKVSVQLKSWCSSPANTSQSLCKIKTKEQLKYGI
tara:strand:+ start:137 stop:670 length:534 start_codon:yes stop_codon:yes gene_type:complete